MRESIDHILFSEEQIQTRIREMAQQISTEYADKDPIFIGVFKGVVLFFADFVKRVSIHCEMDFLQISSYQGTQSKHMELKKALCSDITGRHVVILEDIFDTGHSLEYTYDYICRQAPASVKIVTLLDKPARRDPKVTLQADLVGFTVPNEFVVGYGMDYNEHFRNLPYIGVLKPEVYEG